MDTNYDRFWNVKIDEIIDFSGIEKHIDTPVKRYSSGMYVRLAFAVAAHLDSDILIADEVLAVGDAEFQKKALGKMRDLSASQGRTVLFVSHNMSAVKSLCNKGLVLEKGEIKFRSNNIDESINYLRKPFFLRVRVAAALTLRRIFLPSTIRVFFWTFGLKTFLVLC